MKYIALFCVLAFASVAIASESQNVAILTDADFAEKTGDGKVHFIKFFAPWCGHCKRLAPTWAELGDTFASNDKVEIASVDCTVHKDTCSKADIKGYPTLKVYFNGQEQEKYAGQRALTQLKEFVEAQVKKLTEETTA